jgi:hypothetical protein
LDPCLHICSDNSFHYCAIENPFSSVMLKKESESPAKCYTQRQKSGWLFRSYSKYKSKINVAMFSLNRKFINLNMSLSRTCLLIYIFLYWSCVFLFIKPVLFHWLRFRSLSKAEGPLLRQRQIHKYYYMQYQTSESLS